MNEHPESAATGRAAPAHRRLLALMRRLLPEHGRAQLEVGIVMVTVCLSLTCLQYFGKPYCAPGVYPEGQQEVQDYYDRVEELAQERPELASMLREERSQPHRFEPFAYRWWALFCVISYVLLPLPAILLLCRGRPGRLEWIGLSPRGFLRHLGLYLVLFLAVAPVVVLVSFRKDFLGTYPFLILSHFRLEAWLQFEVCYLLQFLCLEIFFRGFMLFTLERHLGRSAILVMVVPYCMIHYGKPVLETLAAVVAGLVLGELALRLRSIWGGVAIHCAVALLMDLLALIHAGSLAHILG